MLFLVRKLKDYRLILNHIQVALANSHKTRQRHKGIISGENKELKKVSPDPDPLTSAPPSPYTLLFSMPGTLNLLCGAPCEKKWDSLQIEDTVTFWDGVSTKAAACLWLARAVWGPSSSGSCQIRRGMAEMPKQLSLILLILLKYQTPYDQFPSQEVPDEGSRNIET